MANPICGSSSFPWPPPNGTAMSAFHSSDTDIRWDDPATLDTGADTFTVDATEPAYASIVFVGTPDIAAAATGSFIVVSAPIPAGEYLVVDSVVLTATEGAPGFADEFDGSSANPQTVAANIAAAINGGSVNGWGVATAVANNTSVSITAQNAGSGANAVEISSSTEQIVASADTLSGGADPAYLRIGSVYLYAEDERTPGGLNFDRADPGHSIAAAVADPANGLTGLVTAEGSANCVTLLAVAEGEAGNGIAVETNSSYIVVGQPYTTGGSGTPCPPGKNNGQWNIVGVNVYRSDTGEAGPYFRVNRVPVQSLFYRDSTDVGEAVNEVVPWDAGGSGGWIYRPGADAPNSTILRLRTHYRPLVKSPDQERNAVPANAPTDVEVYVDGVRVPVRAVFGPAGEIDLSREAIWNAATEQWEAPPTPSATSVVTVSYWYQKGPKLDNTLDRRWKVFYRLTTVALDPSSPSGLTETPLGFSPPISPMNSERLDYIWTESIRRNRWILEQAGERVKLYVKRMNGTPCDCVWDARLQEYTQQPINNCTRCYGTGWRGGYEGPYNIIIGPDESERAITQTVMGLQIEASYQVWIGPTPTVTQYDFIVKENGERFSIGPVTRTQIRGVTLQQSFQIALLERGDVRYRVPLWRRQLEELPWPQTRYTDPTTAPCVESDPYPVGSEYQAGPMATEVTRVPDNREQRGRTPVWSRITYGGGDTK